MGEREAVILQLRKVQDEYTALIGRILDMVQADVKPEPAAAPRVKGESDKAYYTPREVMARYGISRTTLYRWIREGRLPCGKVWGPRVRRWSREELELID